MLLATSRRLDLLRGGRRSATRRGRPDPHSKAQAAAISQQLVQQQLEVGAYQQQYSVVTARVAADAQAVAQIGQQIARPTSS